MINKYLLAVMGVMVSGVAFACPVIVDKDNRTYSGVSRVNTPDDVDGTTIYFCRTDGANLLIDLNIDENILVNLPNGQTLQNGVANIPFGSASAQAPLSVGSVVMSGGAGITAPTFRQLATTTYPLVNVGVLGHRGIFNFYVRATRPKSQWTPTIKREACDGKHGWRVSHQYIIDYLRINAKDIFNFSNISNQAQWTPSTGTHITTAKINIKAEGTGTGVMPARVEFHWLNNTAGQYFGTERNTDDAKTHLFCWVNVGMTITPDSSDVNFRHSGTFGTKINVMTN